MYILKENIASENRDNQVIAIFTAISVLATLSKQVYRLDKCA